MLTAATLQAAAQDSGSLTDDLKYAAYLVSNNRGALAYSTINDIIKAHPTCAEAYYLRAMAYSNDQNPKPALNDIDLAIRYNTQNTDYRWLKCELLHRQGKYAAAGKCLGELTSAKNNDISDESDARKLLAAEIMVLTDNTIDAIRIINSTVNRGAAFYRARGMAYTSAGMYQMAIDDLAHAIDIDPSLSDCYIWRGLARYKNGQRQEGRADWQTAISKREYKAKEYLDKYK